MPEPVVAVDNLRFRYNSRSEELFDGLTHSFEPASVTALTGASGRGKSTLLYVVGLLLTPLTGSILIDGTDVAHAPDATRSLIRAQRLGFVFQDSELDPSRKVIDSVLEPALYAGHSRGEKLGHARALLEQFGLSGRADHRPGQISGGQAQRLAICRALVNDPDIILADEPTGNLDQDNANLVLDALCEAAHDHHRTVIIATHDPLVMRRCDQRVTL